MTDKELLELAAKAAGIDIFCWAGRDVGSFTPVVMPDALTWNPLTDDGDALRLAVKLKLFDQFDVHEDLCKAQLDSDPYASTRRAITRAAAAIGKEMK
jgi:hypothetical protein